MEAPALQLNCSHPAEFEFDVQVQGLNPAVIPDVRFVISLPLYSLCFVCTRLASPTKWKAMIPVLEGVFTEVSYPFIVEVVTDGYYFRPAEGTIVVISNPKVAVGQTRPTAAVTLEPTADVNVAEPEPRVETAPTVAITATLLQQVQQEAVTEPLPVVTEAEMDEAILAAVDEPEAPPAVERAHVTVDQEPPAVQEAPAKPKMSIFKLKKLGQVTR